MKRKGNILLRKNILKKLLVATGFFIITGTLAGCLQQQQVQPAPVINNGCVILERSYAASEGKTDFNKIIMQTNDRINKKPGKLFKASLHLKLASVYMDHSNPKPNYPQALKELDSYISMGSKSDICMFEAKNIRQILNWMTQAEIVLKEQIKTLESKKGILKDEKGILINEINQCREDVNKLQELDMRMEQRRRELR